MLALDTLLGRMPAAYASRREPNGYAGPPAGAGEGAGVGAGAGAGAGAPPGAGAGEGAATTPVTASLSVLPVAVPAASATGALAPPPPPPQAVSAVANAAEPPWMKMRRFMPPPMGKRPARTKACGARRELTDAEVFRVFGRRHRNRHDCEATCPTSTGGANVVGGVRQAHQPLAYAGNEVPQMLQGVRRTAVREFVVQSGPGSAIHHGRDRLVAQLSHRCELCIANRACPASTALTFGQRRTRNRLTRESATRACPTNRPSRGALTRSRVLGSQPLTF
ncbi:hypothetical protein EZ216_00225 [Ramlibacter humi]|uniref:Uncharacterized protein n=1 Tax=Ramlibacter humi TaxID=2530451 RepID=A0A4Z0CB94_9BURK|nr:hypothetical protein EZ216_00225 [Ramlibacter humi]